MKIQEKIKSLKEKITKYAEAYYLGEPIASDEEFDSLVKELELADPGNSLCKRVSFGINVYGEKEELELYGESSLTKEKDFNIIKEISEDIIITPKLDGCSVFIDYKDGVFKKALSREGVVLTEKIKYIVPNIIEEKSYLRLRGEILMKKDIFKEKYSTEYANSRNIVSAFLFEKNISEDKLKDLEVVFYKIHEHEDNFKFLTKIQMLEYLSRGLKLKTVSIFENKLNEKELEDWKNGQEYLCDGIVITYNSLYERA